MKLKTLKLKVKDTAEGGESKGQNGRDEAEDEEDELSEQAIDNAENGADEVGEDGTNGAEDGAEDREVATNNLEDLSEDGHNELVKEDIRKSDVKRITRMHTVRTPARS